jgi:plasmid stabilization system protein ParE
MIYEILIRPEAENDILDASKWYQEQLDGLGLDFLHILNETFQYLTENPHLFPVVYQDVNRVLVRRFPFAIFYKIVDHIVIVIAVFHASRNPYHWKTR